MSDEIIFPQSLENVFHGFGVWITPIALTQHFGLWEAKQLQPLVTGLLMFARHS